MGLAGTLISGLSDKRPLMSKVARYFYVISIPLAIVAFVAWLAIVVRLSHDTSSAAATLAEVMGWFASRADWIATALLVGAGPAFLSQSGKGSWAPGWLVGWGYVCLFAGLLTVLAMYTGSLTTYGFPVVPVGLSWTIASSIVLFKHNFNAVPQN